jgi:membrane protein YqaA with SNARE-associated domain
LASSDEAIMSGPVDPRLLAISGHAFRHWFVGLGGIGLIPLGLLDSSIIPIPGSMDLLTIVLSARQEGLWLYYAFMATTGSVLGALLTYRLARRGGEAALDRRLRRWQMEKISGLFRRWGFSAVAVPAVMPPPMPMVPFVVAAGATQYPLKRFLAALTLGRVVRYTVLAYLAGRYGRHILHSPDRAAWVVAGLLAAAGFVAFFLWREFWRREPRTN